MDHLSGSSRCWAPLLGLLISVSVCAPVRGDDTEVLGKACGLAEDYVPPWGTAPIPVDEEVPGAIGLGALPVIGCPPAPPAPGEPDVRISRYLLHGSPYEEPNRRMLLQHIPPIRGCYAAHGSAGADPAIDVALTIAGDGLVLGARVVGPKRARALRDCVRAAVLSLRLHGAPHDARSTVTYRYHARR
jgi:hypothetical protein